MLEKINMASTQPAPPDPVSSPPEEELQLRKQADAKTQKEMERQKQLLEQEDAEFKKKLEEKNLKELMEMQRHLREEAESKKSVLDAVRQGDMSALTPYVKKQPEDWIKINTTEDAQKVRGVLAEKHLRNEASIEEVRGSADPTLKMEYAKQWLKETFPTQQTDAILVRDTKGNYMVACLGVSPEEIDAAQKLQTDKHRAEQKSAEVATHIQERVKEESRKTGTASIDETVTAPAPATPNVQREPSSHGRQTA
jgi:hypothetical protein